LSDQPETEPADFEFAFESGISARTGAPFVLIRWGDRAAQVPPFTARQIGAQAFDVANAAESDAAIFHVMVDDMELDEGRAAQFVAGLRAKRVQWDSTPEAQFAFHDTDAEDEGASGKLPDKVPGKHRWMVAASYSIRADEVELAMDGEQIHLDHETRFSLVIGCFDCEQPYQLAKGQPCSGDPDDK
jgi:hypothetical protein